MRPLPLPSPSSPAPSPTVAQAQSKSPAVEPPIQNQVAVNKSAAAAKTRTGATRLPEANPPSEQEVISRQVARATKEYQGAILLLEKAVARRRTELDPAAAAQYESSLAIIDDSIAASRRALHENPSDPNAARFLLAAYSRKVDLMQEIALR